jgi:methyl-accepting chemotaxis protein
MSTAENNTSATGTGGTSVIDMTPEQTAEAIKNIAKNIRESSNKIREAVRTIHKSGAIDEVIEAIREATVAARDTAKEVNDVAKDMKERGVVRETINTAEEVNITAHDTVQTVKDTVSRKPKSGRDTKNISKRSTKARKSKSRK